MRWGSIPFDISRFTHSCIRYCRSTARYYRDSLSLNIDVATDSVCKEHSYEVALALNISHLTNHLVSTSSADWLLFNMSSGIGT